MKRKFKPGDEVICLHYPDKPVVKVLELHGRELWVEELDRGGGILHWWGYPEWFKLIRPMLKKGKRK